MYVRDPLRVEMSGPLEPYRGGFRAELERLGYSGETACKVVRLMAAGRTIPQPTRAP